jgi:hypothetical protein
VRQRGRSKGQEKLSWRDQFCPKRRLGAHTEPGNERGLRSLTLFIMGNGSPPRQASAAFIDSLRNRLPGPTRTCRKYETKRLKRLLS